MSYWLKMVGAADFKLSERPFDDEHREELRTLVRFPRGKVPRELSVGDEFIYYAVIFQRVFAQSRLTGRVRENVPNPSAEVRRRWPDAGEILLGPYIQDLANAPLLVSVVPGLQGEIHQGVTILPMGRPEYDECVGAIRRARADEDLRDRRFARQPS